MKITCERCSAQYDLDDKRIPPSGMTMKCPACLHSFVVRRSGATQPAAPPIPVPPIPVPPPAAAPPAKREIELSSFDEGPTPLPASAPGMMAPDPDEIDLPAPKIDTPELPAPKAPGRAVAIPPPRPPAAAMAPRPSPPPLPTEPSLPPVRATAGPDEIDLPAPVDPKSRDLIDLPAPKSPGTPSGLRPIALAHDEIDLVAPKDRPPQVGVSLDAPEIDDLPLTGALGDDGGPPALQLDTIDVVAPKTESPELPTPKLETMDVAPRAETLDVAPRLETLDMAPKPGAPEVRDVAPKAAPAAAAVAARGEPAPAKKADAAAKKADPAKKGEEAAGEAAPSRRWPRVLAAVAGVTLLLGGVGVALGMFTDFGQQLLHRGPSAEVEQQLNAARKLMADDTVAAYKKAALQLQPFVDGDARLPEAVALSARARLSAARLGLPSELRSADALLAKLTDEKSAQLPEVQKARALRAVVAGNWAEARAKLNAVLQKAPADAVALTYLGWTELGAGDPAAADRAFSRALAAEATRAAALYGDGVAQEELHHRAAAHDLYGRVLARSPQHFGALVGEARTGKPATEAQAAIEQLIQQRAPTAAPKELADAWTTVGALAADAGRREEAEDRLKRALGLDPDNAAARVTLARVQCDLGHPGDALEPLGKLVAAQPKNLDARLALTRAQLETGAVADAQKTLAPALQQAPKAAPVLYWQARTLLAAAKPDREQAVARLKDAIAADAKFIPAYVAESTAFAALGKPDDAVAALQAAQAQATDDPALMTELGEAYLALNRPADAEARFRAALDKKPDARTTRMDLGAALEAEGKLDDARAQYDQVASEDGKFPGVLERQARLAVKQGRKADAAKLFDAALKQGVPTQALRLAAAQLFLDPDIGRGDDARKLAEAVVNEDERSATAHMILARAQFDAGHVDEALPEARRAVTLGDLPEAHLVLARVLESAGKLDQAIQEYGLARRPPVENEAAIGRARILVRMGATKDALSELAALAKDPKLKARALLLEGDCYSDLQQQDRARHAYEDAAKAAPDSGEAAFKLGRALHDAGRRHDAIAQLERARKLGGDKAPWAAEAELLIGDAHREGHENEAAVKAYKKYLDLAPASAPERAEVQKHISILEGG